MGQFADFEAEYGPPADCLRPSEEQLERYESSLPAALIQEWRDRGWCSWGNGLLWTVDPAQLADVLDDWVGFENEPPIVFLRSAFGHLYFWCEGAVWSLEVHRGSLARVTENIAFMFTLLRDPEVKERILRASLYERALRRLGRPDRDECYAFEPALALGGSGAVETVRRVELREHLGLLAQIVR